MSNCGFANRGEYRVDSHRYHCRNRPWTSVGVPVLATMLEPLHCVFCDRCPGSDRWSGISGTVATGSAVQTLLYRCFFVSATTPTVSSPSMARISSGFPWGMCIVGTPITTTGVAVDAEI